MPNLKNNAAKVQITSEGDVEKIYSASKINADNVIYPESRLQLEVEAEEWLDLKPDAWVYSPGLWFSPPTAANPFTSSDYFRRIKNVQEAGYSLGPETRTIYRSISAYPLRSYRSPINQEDSTFPKRSNLTWVQQENNSRKRLNNYHEWMNGLAINILQSALNANTGKTSDITENEEDEKTAYYNWRSKHFPLNNWDILDVWNMMMDRPELATDSVHFTGIGSKHITNVMLNMIINSIYLSKSRDLGGGV